MISNQEIAAQVGQDKPKKDAVEVYDDRVGRYKQDTIHVNPSGGLPAQPSPFTLSGGGGK